MEQSNQTPIVKAVVVEKKKGALRDFVEAFILALLVALPIKFFVASPFIVVGTSMFPTFKGGDYLIIDKLVYKWSDPKRGDVIVFTPPVNVNEYYIKRVVGLPGETIHVSGNVIKINGNTLTEPYVSSLRAGDTDITLKPDQYFVMGDNRAVSSDSRVWGPVTKEEMSGRADVRLFPFSAIGIMPGVVKTK